MRRSTSVSSMAWRRSAKPVGDRQAGRRRCAAAGGLQPGPEPVPRAGHRTEAGAAGHRRAGRGLPGCAGERLDRPGAAAAGPPHHRLHPAVHPYRPEED
ncbi:hypothetical protein G6F24_018244 [Rhizopus arrhizus]|nr:hypothetical protein G6F24_018244 [Rhizopus arrhizus]